MIVIMQYIFLAGLHYKTGLNYGYNQCWL